MSRKFCEFVVFYEYLGTDKSKLNFEVYSERLDKIEGSEQKCIINEEESLPKLLILSNGDVMNLRKRPKCLNYPNFSDQVSRRYSEVLLFGTVESELDLQDEERVAEIYEERVEQSNERKVDRNKMCFLKKMRS